ncbi:MAG: ABC transporter ATP-binding protein [Zavarzinia sp.]|nr:ABC transporter ATP-binding protein [Zavarzinia sp.]
MDEHPTPILETRALSVVYGGLVAVDRISLAVRPGEIYGLLGPNGAGKTTLLNTIAGAGRATSGEILFRGRSIGGWRPDRRARAGIARTFQITRPFEDLSVEENVMVGALTRFGRLDEMRSAVRDIVDRVGLSHKRGASAGDLSTGQRKRLELARALATSPSVLLMDEVTGGVDQPSIPGLIDLVAALRESGVTVILIEHNMRVIVELCDRVMFLDNGCRVGEGTPQEVMSLPAVVELYLGKGGGHA